MSSYVSIIGMEIHVELNTNSKMFCACPNDPELTEHTPTVSTPNTNICPICLGHPGTLPVPNREAIKKTVLIGKALGCTIRPVSKFDRKHYFYPDLPKGYQISQYDEPIAEHGSMSLTFSTEENIRETATIGVERVHLEEDTAKLLHDTNKNTLADFNRSGAPLVEIVTMPDFKTALEAKTFCQELRTLLRALHVSDADMEKGHMRCEANVSVQTAGQFEIVDGKVHPLGTYTLNNKVEVKNINSFKAVEKAILFEIERQTALLEHGESWPQQTRGWDDTRGETVLQRIKENAADYRYFPEPDIPPFHPQEVAKDIRLPELPQQKRARFHAEYGFSYSDAKLFSEQPVWAHFAEAVMSELAEWITTLTTKAHDEPAAQKVARLAGGWITSKLMGALADRSLEVEDLRITPENFAELIALIYDNRVNSTNAQKILSEMLDAGTDIDPTHIMEDRGYGQVSDTAALGTLADDVITSYPKQVAEFRAGKEPVIKFLIGMMMKASEGSADPIVAEQMLRERLQ